jgi:hypothetical protein
VQLVNGAEMEAGQDYNKLQMIPSSRPQWVLASVSMVVGGMVSKNNKVGATEFHMSPSGQKVHNSKFYSGHVEYKTMRNASNKTFSHCDLALNVYPELYHESQHGEVDQGMKDMGMLGARCSQGGAYAVKCSPMGAYTTVVSEMCNCYLASRMRVIGFTPIYLFRNLLFRFNRHSQHSQLETCNKGARTSIMLVAMPSKQ